MSAASRTIGISFNLFHDTVVALLAGNPERVYSLLGTPVTTGRVTLGHDICDSVMEAIREGRFFLSEQEEAMVYVHIYL